MHLPKVQKRQSSQAGFFALLGPVCVKAVHKHIDEIDSNCVSRRNLEKLFPAKMHYRDCTTEMRMRPYTGKTVY